MGGTTVNGEPDEVLRLQLRGAAVPEWIDG